MINLKNLIISILIPNLSGFIGNKLGNSQMEFMTIAKPNFTPPAIVFPIVWIILYILMGISSYIIYSSKNSNKSSALFTYWIQLVLNTLWTYFFFNLKWFLFSFFWILTLLITVLIMIYQFSKINRTAALLQIPYVIWLIYAGTINIGVYFLNR